MEETPENIKVEPTIPWYVRLWRWLVELFTYQPLYQITVWYVYETTFNEQGFKSQKRSQRVYRVKRVDSKTNKYISGIDEENMPFEIRTVDPFDFEIKQIK